jgi:type II secretory pathway component PulJ
MRPLILLLCCTVILAALEEDERAHLREQLTSALQEADDAHARLLPLAESAQIVVPPGVATTLAARRTLVQDWLARLANPATTEVGDDYHSVRDGLFGLGGRFEAANAALETLGSFADRWSDQVQTPVGERYRAFLRTRAQQVLQQVAAGAEDAGDDDQFWRRNRRHELLLQLAQLDTLTDERRGLIPAGHPALQEFAAQAAAVRTLALAGLDQGALCDDQALDRGEAVLWLLDDVLGCEQHRVSFQADTDQPPTAVQARLFDARLAGEVAVLRQLIAHHQSATPADETAWQQTEQTLRRERDRLRRMTELVQEWQSLTRERLDHARQIAEILPSMPPADAREWEERRRALAISSGAAEVALSKALEVGEHADAVRALSDVRLAQLGHQAVIDDLHLRLTQVEEREAWREHAGKPGVAAALKRLDDAYAAVVAARQAEREASARAVRAALERDLAELSARQAEEAADAAREQHGRAFEALDQRRNEVTDAVENPQPLAEGDGKF